MLNKEYQVAAGGLLDRRLFLRRGVFLGSAAWLGSAAATLEPWSRVLGAPFSNYGQPAPFEKRNIRWISANHKASGNGVSWSPLHLLEGSITPNGLHFERHHNGVPHIDPERHRLRITGLVRRQQLFSLDTLLRYPQLSRICFIECGGNSNAAWNEQPIQVPAGYFHGLVSGSEWTGVPLSLLLDECGILPSARWLIAEGGDASRMHISLPLDKAVDDCLLALYQNGERLRPENGYPLRLLVPGWEGVLQVKWLRRLHVAEKPAMSRNETAAYSELLPSGKIRQFSFVMAEKSLITRPSAGMQLQGAGLYCISGLAWSGRGRIVRVEISADGGSSWAEAELQQPCLPMALTRFRIPWGWDGAPVVLQSRAIDEQGYRQPSRGELLRRRGNAGYFHYHAIVSWAVSADGQVSHVYR